MLADERRIEQVLVNLLTNANKYSRRRRRVCGRRRGARRTLLVSVEDHGPGINPQDRAHIFDRFYRAWRRADEATGAGLGLAIVRTIVEAHRGRIGVDAVTPHGARFWFTLPLVATDEPA